MNSRFRELAPGMVVEQIATRIEFSYVPRGMHFPQELTATWWAQEFLPVGDGFQQIGNGGSRLVTRLSDHATTLRTITDPVTGQEVTLSALGAVVWLQDWFDYQHNLENTPVPEPEPEPEPDPEP